MSLTIDELLKQSVNDLKMKGVENNTVLDAQLILCHLLNVDRLYLTVNRDRVLENEIVVSYRALIEQRAKGQPVQYITGHQEFMSLSFKVTPDVLIPRADTETAVEYIIEQCAKHPMKNGYKMIDIGTGSGCIAVSLAYYIANSRITAIDISQSALEIARENAKGNHVGSRIDFICHDILRGFPALIQFNSVDVIISNPPYISTDVIEGLQREVRNFEPRNALDGGRDGLNFYRKIISCAAHYLKPDGLLVFEVGHDQSNDVMAILQSTEQYDDIEFSKDLAGIKRVVSGRKRMS